MVSALASRPFRDKLAGDREQTWDLALPDITLLDYFAFAFYVASWIGYTLFADYSPWRRHNIMKTMDAYRERWMQQMLRRENRMVDANIIGSLQNGAAFFASTTIFALGGLIAALGASEQAMGILSTLHMDQFATAETWQIKVLAMIAIMSYAFFKFAWTFRLQNYCAVFLGADCGGERGRSGRYRPGSSRRQDQRPRGPSLQPRTPRLFLRLGRARLVRPPGAVYGYDRLCALCPASPRVPLEIPEGAANQKR